MAGLQLIVGLGNPGLEYAQTRRFVAALARKVLMCFDGI